MAVSSSTATLYITQKALPLSTPRSCFALRYRGAISSKQPKTLTLRCSGEASPVETSAGEADPESSIEAPESSPSIISALNVERALRGIPITDVDHYGRLGLQRGCSTDQVDEAFKSKSEQVLNQGLEAEELNEQLEMLKESYAILSTVEDRRLYDWSLARSTNPDTYVWPYEVDSSKASPDDPPAQEPEDVGPTRAVGYFLLGWIVLSFVMSITLNLIAKP